MASVWLHFNVIKFLFFSWFHFKDFFLMRFVLLTLPFMLETPCENACMHVCFPVILDCLCVCMCVCVRVCVWAFVGFSQWSAAAFISQTCCINCCHFTWLPRVCLNLTAHIAPSTGLPRFKESWCEWRCACWQKKKKKAYKRLHPGETSPKTSLCWTRQGIRGSKPTSKSHWPPLYLVQIKRQHVHWESIRGIFLCQSVCRVEPKQQS